MDQPKKMKPRIGERGIGKKTLPIIEKLARHPNIDLGLLASEFDTSKVALARIKKVHAERIAARRAHLLALKRAKEAEAAAGVSPAIVEQTEKAYAKAAEKVGINPEPTTMSLAMQKALASLSNDDEDDAPKQARPVEVRSPDETQSLLARRGSVYGEFKDNAAVAQGLKAHVYAAAHRKGKPFPAVEAEAMDMILSKIARISNGAPDQLDSWDDIAGYAKLASAEIKKRIAER